ncbi:hypoxanthine phosphoribosyltransferase [Pseudoramibacter alactolyticus]|uniref:hypoxanthine phosphoribosyltransferase n=1 Tax=Pseudoramibacter alactolyticus TaxID=113287 RepID=UPI0023565043|nr:hypoxanthine phosphoribosyltransferase [Pseudoramibacter alactolyticus]MBM6967414.1 hypoxanthine phosphoribosyltransferase [Pseudoramibacter alactolyticus]
MLADIEKVLLTEEQLRTRIRELGRNITADYRDKPLLALCILRGSFIFFADLVRSVGIPVEVAFMHAASYFADTKSSGEVQLPDEAMLAVGGKNVLIVEDIVDSGRTLNALKETLLGKNVSSLKIATLLDKPERRVVDIDVDYCGFQVPDEFVVGYGLDYNQRYRNLPYIGILKREIYN